MSKRGFSRLLLISYSFPPINHAGAYRLLSFARHFNQSGIDVSVVTPSIGKKMAVDDQLLDMLSDQVKVYHTKAYKLPFIENEWLAKNIVGKVWNRLINIANKFLVPVDSCFFWIFSAFFQAKKLINTDGVDTVLVSSPPHSSQLIGLLLKKVFNVRLVVDFRDGWKHNIFNRVANVPLSRFQHWAETSVLKSADLIIANTPTNKVLLEQDYPFVSGKVHVITNGYFKDEGNNADEYYENVSFNNEKFILAYTGEFYEGYSKTILNALSKLKKRRPDLSQKFIFEIVGLMYDEDHELVRSLDIEDVVNYRGFVPYKQATSLAKNADVLLITYLDNPNVNNVVPSKLYFYMGLRKLILAIAPSGDSADIIKEVNAGCVIPPSDVDAVSQQIEQWIYSDEKPKANYNEEIREHYSREYLAKKLHALIEEIANR